MKAGIIWLLCILTSGVVCGFVPVDITPELASDRVVPVNTDSVSLKMPYCYFNNRAAECPDNSNCEIWLVSSLTSATKGYDDVKLTDPRAPYDGAYTATGKNYSTIKVNTLSNIPCTAAPPHTLLVGKEKSCTETYCNGLLPQGQNMSFKYILTNGNVLVAETKWSKDIPLKSVKGPETIGSAYAGRSGAMVVITSILAAAAALLLLLLLVALILLCCSRKKATHSYETKPKASLIGSLRVPSYDVHHLKKPSPYDNPAYEQNMKKRYTTTSTLPQGTTTVITHVHSNPSENVIVQKM